MATDFKVDFVAQDTFNVAFENDSMSADFALDTFSVDFEAPSPFSVTFSEQGAQGPVGDDATVTLWTATTSFMEGELARDENYKIYISDTNNNVGNALTDSDFWTPVESSGQITFTDLRSTDDYNSGTLELAANTGLEFVQDGNRVVLQQYVAPAALAITFASIPNKSWFGSDETLTRTVSATSGTLDSITATGAGSPVVSGLDISFTASATPGAYSLRADGTGTDAGGNAATAHHSDSYTTYRDWYLHTGQSSATATGQLSGGRQNFALNNNHSFTVSASAGHTYIAYSTDLTVEFQTNLGVLVPTYSYVQNYTEDGVTHEYRVAYLGFYSTSSTITAEVS